jgi:hypothetical protein
MPPEKDPLPEPISIIPPVSEPADPAEALKLIKNDFVTPDSVSVRENVDLEGAKKREDIKSLEQDRRQRLIFGWLLFGFVIVWLLFVGVTLWFSALKWHGTFTISDTVLVTLLSTTTINVIGLLATVALYLFPKR